MYRLVGKKKKKYQNPPACLVGYSVLRDPPFPYSSSSSTQTWLSLNLLSKFFDVSSRVCLLRVCYNFCIEKKDQTNLKKKKEEVLITKHKTKLQTLMSFSKKYGVSFFYYEYQLVDFCWLVYPSLEYTYIHIRTCYRIMF